MRGSCLGISWSTRDVGGDGEVVYFSGLAPQSSEAPPAGASGLARVSASGKCQFSHYLVSVLHAHFLDLAPLSSNVSLTPASKTVMADQQTVRETRRRSQAGVVAAGPCESCACCACPFSHPSLLPHIFSPCLQDAWRRVFDHTPRSSSALQTGRVAATCRDCSLAI